MQMGREMGMGMRKMKANVLKISSEGSVLVHEGNRGDDLLENVGNVAIAG